MKKYKTFRSFILSTSGLQILVVSASILVGLGVYIGKNENFKEQWEDWINISFSAVTLFVAILIWYNEKKLDWKNNLPKKLYIEYHLNGEVFAIVNNAPLAGENDIRNWGQSIGQTILNRRTSIEFSGFEIRGPSLERKRRIMQYELIVHLFSPIPGIKKGEYFDFEDNGNLSASNREKIRNSIVKPPEKTPCEELLQAIKKTIAQSENNSQSLI